MMFRVFILFGLCSILPFVSQGQEAATEQKSAKIAWHDTWQGGLAEAQRTGKPIMLVSVAGKTGCAGFLGRGTMWR